MGTVKIVDVLDRANTVLNDATKVRWPFAELLGWYNDAQRAIIIRRPDANSQNTTFACVNDSLQSLPTTALRLIDIIRNEDNGTAITKMTRDIFDNQYRNWHSTNGTKDVKHFTYDDLDPKTFYLFPVPIDAHSIRLIYSQALPDAVIADFDTDVQTIGLSDTYTNALIDFILYRAFLKDSEYSQNSQRSSASFAAFENSIGKKTQIDSAVSPNA